MAIILFFWLPGYLVVKLVFPKRTPKPPSKENLEPLERVALSIGISMALAPMVGLFLNYTPSGITLTPTVLTLVAVIISLSFVTLAKEYRNVNA